MFNAKNNLNARQTDSLSKGQFWIMFIEWNKKFTLAITLIVVNINLYYPLDRAEYQAFVLIGLKRSIYVRKLRHFGNYKPVLPYDTQDGRSRCKQTKVAKTNCKESLRESLEITNIN